MFFHYSIFSLSCLWQLLSAWLTNPLLQCFQNSAVLTEMSLGVLKSITFSFYSVSLLLLFRVTVRQLSLTKFVLPCSDNKTDKQALDLTRLWMDGARFHVPLDTKEVTPEMCFSANLLGLGTGKS